jgi:hypothetical protein
MNIIQGIESGDKASILLSTSVFAGVVFGIWRKKGLLMTSVYAVGFGLGGLVINNVFKIK